MDLSGKQLPIDFKRLIGLKITLVKFTYSKGLTGRFPICPIILSWKHAFTAALSCEQALRDTLAAGREKEGELATTSLKFEFHLQLPFGAQSTELLDFPNQREAETSANVKKHWKTRAKGNDVISNVISANQHFASM